MTEMASKSQSSRGQFPVTAHSKSRVWTDKKYGPETTNPAKRFSKAVTTVRAYVRFKTGPQRAGEGSQSLASTSTKNPVIVKENTYKMEPDPACKFKSKKVEIEMRKVIESNMVEYVYNALTAKAMSGVLTDKILNRVKELGFDRFKLVCSVLIGQKTGQSINVCSRSIWDEGTDSFTSVRYDTSTCYVVAMLHATYAE